MPLVASAITYLCMSAPAGYGDACNKATEATTKQIGFYQDLDFTEKKTAEVATQFGQNTMGKDGMIALGIGPYLYRAYKDRDVKIKLPKIANCSSVSGDVKFNSLADMPTYTYGLKMEWKW